MELTVSSSLFQVRLLGICREAERINSYEFGALDGGALPSFSAGAHIDLHLPNGMVRGYSLVNCATESNRYVIAVNQDPASRGGSRYMHEMLKVGDAVTVNRPRNNFSLCEDAPHSVLLAGGIGITPLLSMVHRLVRLGRSWDLYYCGRTRAGTAFLGLLERLAQNGGGKVHLNFDQQPGGAPLEIAAALRPYPEGTHFYCCGPLPMLAAFEAASAHRSPACVHLEYFAAREAPAADGGFVVELARSKRRLEVAAGQSILDVLLDAGVQIGFACMEGACGECRTRVLEGTPEHRDVFLNRAQREANDTMMVCCSGCKGTRLVLDL